MASGAGPGPDLAVGPHVPLVFAGALLVMCVGERLVHAAATLLVALIGGGAPSPRAAKAASARALLLRAADLVVELVRAWAQTLAGLLQWAVYYVLFAAILLLVVYLGGALADADAGLAARLLRVWNGGVGATLRGVLLVPLQALELVFATLVPFWNAVQFFLRGLVSAVAVPALQAQMTTVLKTVTSLQAVFRALAGSLVAYCETVRPCNDAACLAPGERVFDFLSPVLALRVVAVHVLDFLRASCAIATPAAEALLYPVLDANFAQSLHLALNVPLYAVVQVPLVTHARCSQAASFSDARPPRRRVRAGLCAGLQHGGGERAARRAARGQLAGRGVGDRALRVRRGAAAVPAERASRSSSTRRRRSSGGTRRGSSGWARRRSRSPTG